ncbi:DapH/DapD/GlmU-related protein [Xenorhabdus lircayensis]|uniref:Acetyltransferase n=1 Tax=Xenorhabdus lircayensis TaxID=2763499 RepID=A0ABS0U2D4_9GAMM|nr:DapH/DapD/GlmU-related protein [Xenorhabdus lircayensis]MBI6548024.1 acetyltransferase [Xenorhabdus lircayensis]
MLLKIKSYFKHYRLLGCISLFVNYIYTKIFFPKARLIRRPFDIRGYSYIDISNNLTTGHHCRIEAHNEENRVVLFIGENCQLNDFVHIAAAEKIKIGNNVLIASRVFISDLNHGSYSGTLQSHPESICNERALSTSPVTIEDNVWLGEGVVVLPGVSIGRCSIIGANAVVSRDIPPYSIAVGNPAKVIKQYNNSTENWNRV